ncbi:uncharacterized protein LOC106383011 [Brassica napus]|uniref:uncharacterized protein LOC106383011 n=1 Tax=Brassica napus TaxID=3708 RepID=UPI0020790282|nr:uncharacterized protein LOC106383011 [Brassica napus]
MIQDMLGNEFYAGAYKVPGQNQWTECSSVELKNRFLDLTGQKQGETCRVDEEGLMAHLRCPGLFLGQTVRKGNTKVQFSKEANNLCNLNSYNHSGNFYYNDLCYYPYNYDLLLSELRNMTRIHVYF